MRVRTLLVLMSVLALVVVAPEVAVAKAGGTERPLKGSGSGTTTFDVASVPFPASGEGTATLSHLGTASYSLNYVILPGAPGTFSVAGTGTFVAANGDELSVAFTGSGHDTSAATSETMVHVIVTGGTGRFQGADGTLTGTVITTTTSIVGTTVTADQTLTLDGSFSY